MHAGQTCTVVAYTATHLEDISQIDRLCFIDPWLKRSFIDELSAPQSLNLVVTGYGSGHALGYCLGRVIADECTINRFGVHPDYQRKGIATCLLKTFLDRAGRQGAHNCFIDVRAGNTAARRFYEGLGFNQIGVRQAYYQIGHEDAILMQYIIANSSQ